MHDTSTASTFGTRLAAKRRAAGLTQEQLGEGLADDGSDMGKGAVSSWEVDRTRPNTAQLTRICNRLKCSSDDLLGLDSVEGQPTAHQAPHSPPSSPPP